MRTRWGRLYAGTGAATLSLLAATATGVHAAPGADPVDVEARQYFDHEVTAPGETFGVRAIADLMTGRVTRLGLTLTLPQGVTYVRTGDNAADAVCTPSADGRSVKCAAKDGKSDVSAQVVVKVGADVAPGTELTFTTTADLGDTVDAKPENNTASGKVTVRKHADLGVEWKAPSGRTPVGEDVKTDLVVTNHGPGPVKLEAVHFTMGWDYWPKPGYDKNCWADPGVMICDVFRELAPAETVTFSFTWNFPKKAAGTTYRVPASLYSTSPLDPNQSNDEDTLVFKFAKSPASPRPTAKPTPSKPPASSPAATPTPSATPSSSAPSSTGPAGGGSQPSPQGGGGHLAATGAGPAVATAATATALVLTGGAVVLWNRGRRRERGSHL
ncbi:hypothetical protein [Streptomyces sp. BK239]|uniref:hypothetical protein n=1 Tax=Streptomyces sp. BK239 TaxID=2512155 RepID=UPI00102B1436|nr:hypothetical protein [Streptomyces sp. BK239]RZU16864.1 hypothetical protein EV567_3296 [Streptomyces sp. BK239]